ncbi:MAG TPA: hypothetical protein VIJ55_15995 [Acetobacteraceae bacterium]
MAASTLDVTNLSNSGTVVGSLAHELGLARNGDTIVIDPSLSSGTIDLATTLTIAKNVAVEGNGVTLSGGDAGPVLDIGSGATVALDGLSIIDGNATGKPGGAGSPGKTGGAAAGGIYDAGDLSVTNTRFADDTATGGAGGAGAGSGSGGGAGGAASGAIYVARAGAIYSAGGTLSLGLGTVSSSPTLGPAVVAVAADAAVPAPRAARAAPTAPGSPVRTGSTRAWAARRASPVEVALPAAAGAAAPGSPI